MTIYRMNFAGLVAATSGKGLWSSAVRAVTVHQLELEVEEHYDDPSFTLAALFTRNQWSTDKHGLIYTDPQWLREFKACLVEAGFSKKAVKSIEYTEQGMQGDDYVSLSCGELFAAEFINSRQCYGKRGASKVSAEFKKRIASMNTGAAANLNHPARPAKSQIASLGPISDAIGKIATEKRKKR